MISVIVPVYNSINTLARCLDSVLSQNGAGYELIVVDDGSSDGTSSLCDEYANRDKKVRVFHKENGGVSSARNLGIDSACGEWILFLDSDDQLPDGSLEIYEKYVKKNPESACNLIFGNIILVYSDGSKRNVYKTDVCTIEDLHQSGFMGCVWDKLYNKDILLQHGIRYDETLFFGEDWLFVAEYCSYIKSISYISEPCYIQYLPVSYANKYKQAMNFPYMNRVYQKIKKVNKSYSDELVDGLTMTLIKDICGNRQLLSEYTKFFKKTVGEDIKYAKGARKSAIRLLRFTSNPIVWRRVINAYSKLYRAGLI